MEIPAKVEMTQRPGWYRSRVEIQGTPMISVIIPNKDHIDDLELCLSSLTERSTYENYEVLIVETTVKRLPPLRIMKSFPSVSRR